MQLLKALEPNDRPKRREFAEEILEHISEDEAFLKQVCFSDETTFHVSGKLNRNNVRIWGSEHPHETRMLHWDSPKVNVWGGILFDRIIGPFFFKWAIITADVYLDFLTKYVAPQLIDLQLNIIFQKDGAPPH